MTLRLVKTEAWALDIVSRVKSGNRVEDARVELKREWPDCEKGARRIAGHANSCFGSDILWIIGLDEDIGITGVEPKELANWWQCTSSYFDGVTPSLTDLIIYVDDQSLVCLLFETSRPPYVVKNPKFGTSNGGPVSLEVPWREGTSVRSATRNDLIRLLVPTIAQPEVEVLGGSGLLKQKKEEYPGDKVFGVRLSFRLTIYLVPRGEASVVIPFHRCQCVVNDKNKNSIDEFKFTMYRPQSFHSHGSSPDTVTIERTSSELIAHGPGKCSIDVQTIMECTPEWLCSSDLDLRFIVHIVDCERPLEIDVSANQVKPRKDELMRWTIL